jgi:hypothetical protein
VAPLRIASLEIAMKDEEAVCSELSLLLQRAAE